MERVCRPSMSTAERAEVWRRWKRGESGSDIGRALGRLRKSVHRVVAAQGGVSHHEHARAHRAELFTGVTAAAESRRARRGGGRSAGISS